MRLMDLVAAAGMEHVHEVGGAHAIAVRGVGAYNQAVKACPLRYVLGDEVGRLCETLINTDAGMLEPGNSFLRLPAECFWLEWNRDGSLSDSRERGRQRIGCLIEADANGRSGTVHSFWVDEAGNAQAGQVYLDFDLDHRPSASGLEVCRANHERPEFPGVA
jgi:hypothetical protein